MKCIVVLFLSLFSTSCGAQGWYDHGKDKAADKIDDTRDEWIRDRARDVIFNYRKLLVSAISNESSFKINPIRCLDDSFCEQLAATEETRKSLYVVLSRKYENIMNANSSLDACEQYRNSAGTLTYFINKLKDNFSVLEKLSKNPTMGDILQFGSDGDNLAAYYVQNKIILIELEASLIAVNFLFNYIYPSDNYIPALSDVANPLKPLQE